MKLTRFVVALALTLSFYASDSPAQSPATVKNANKPLGVIAGRVTARGKGLSDIIVTLRTAAFGGGGQTQNMPQAKTDADGKYRIEGVPMGSYYVTPVAPVYIVPNAAARFTSANEAVVITNGETVEGIDFSLVRGGVITGKVSDADGRPIIEQPVSLQNNDQQQGGPGAGVPMMIPGNFRTDDRGQYRIYGLPAGHYIVSVGAQRRMSAFSTVMGQQSYPQTFYPNATDSSQATVVEVAEGDEVSHIDITVGNAVEAYSVTGRVLDSTTNAPVVNVGFLLSVMAGGGGGRQQQQRAVGAMPLPAISDANGQFRVDNVPPGRYVISVAPQASSGTTGQSAPFDVINQDVNNVEIRTVTSASLSGVVALEGTQDQTILTELLQFQVQVFVQGNAAPAASAQVVPLNPDGTFQVSGLPAGTVNLSLAAPQDGDMQGAFKLLRTELNGAPQRRGIPVNPGDQVSGVRLVAAYADGIVEGVVTVQNGTLAPGTLILARLVPVNAQGRANLGAATVDQRGRFLIENVPVGTYNLILSVNAQPARRGQRQAPIVTQQQVTVSEGQIANISATLDLAQTATPTPTP